MEDGRRGLPKKRASTAVLTGMAGAGAPSVLRAGSGSCWLCNSAIVLLLLLAAGSWLVDVTQALQLQLELNQEVDGKIGNPRLDSG